MDGLSEQRRMSATQPPYCLSLLLCDGVHVDQSTRKRFILGTFSTVFSSEFPFRHSELSVWFEITDGLGRVEVIVRLVRVRDGEEDQPVAEVNTEIQFEDPRVVQNGRVIFHNLSFESPGEYRFQLFGNGDHLMERRLLVINPTQSALTREDAT